MKIGVAGWNIPTHLKPHFSTEGTHLEKYARVLSAVEVNSSFYRDHQCKTYQKWRAATPEDFRFSVKLNQRFSHDKTFKPSLQDLGQCLDAMSGLEEKWSVLLIQFPGSLEFSPKIEKLFKCVRKKFEGHIVLEPRNLSWIEKDALDLYRAYNMSKVSADPERCSSKRKLNFSGIEYYRLHGSPELYRSSYSQKYLLDLSLKLTPKSWCIFDNTTFGHATENALTLQDIVL